MGILGNSVGTGPEALLAEGVRVPVLSYVRHGGGGGGTRWKLPNFTSDVSSQAGLLSCPFPRIVKRSIDVNSGLVWTRAGGREQTGCGPEARPQRRTGLRISVHGPLVYSLLFTKALGLIISAILYSSEGLVSLSRCPGGRQVNFPAGLLLLSLARQGLGREWQDLAWLSLFTRGPQRGPESVW